MTLLGVMVTCCSPASDPDLSQTAHPFRTDVDLISLVEVDAVSEDGSALVASSDLCSLVVSNAAGAGLYRVERLVAVTERSLESTSGREEVVYSELALIQDWSGRARDPLIARNRGSYVGTRVATSEIALDVGEQVLVLYWSTRADFNGGFPRLLEDMVFRETTRGFTNGLITFAMGKEELRMLFESTYAAVPAETMTRPLECSSPTPADRCPDGARVPADAEVRFTGSEPADERCVDWHWVETE